MDNQNMAVNKAWTRKTRITKLVPWIDVGRVK